VEKNNWRNKSSYIMQSGDIETASVLFGQFLKDRSTLAYLPEKDLFTDGKFEWGTPPLEKVVVSPGDLEYLIHNPHLFGNSISIIEPWNHVGFHPTGVPVRASKNIAYIAQKIADCGSILFPIWQLGVQDIKKIVEITSRTALYVIEGGDASAHKPEEWTNEACTLEDMQFLVETLLQRRGPKSSPGIFICVGHQLVGECLIRLLKKVCDFVSLLDELPNDPGGEVFQSIKKVAQNIQSVGETLQVRKRDGSIVANGWNDEDFAISDLHQEEVGKTFIRPYDVPKKSGLNSDIINAHLLVEEELETVLDQMMRLRYEAEMDVTMFHSQEVSEVAMLFANWAYGQLHKTLMPHRAVVATSPISWFLKLPYAVKILAKTESSGETLTECASMCIAYKDHDTKLVRRNFTIQFHPELLPDLHEFGRRSAPDFSELQQADSVRLLVRLIYLGLHD